MSILSPARSSCWYTPRKPSTHWKLYSRMTTLWNNYFSTGINYNQRNTHMRLSNLGQRFITALLGAAVIIGCTLISPYSFSACFYLLAMLTQYEYLRILTPLKGETPQQQLHIAGNLTLGTIVYFLIALIAYGVIDTSYYSLFFVLFAGIVILELYKNRPNPFQYIGLRIIGLVYVVIPFALLNTISISADNFYPLITLGILCIIWANDVFAYFAGRAFGKHKLFERISPKKPGRALRAGLSLHWPVRPFYHIILPLSPSPNGSSRAPW